MKPRNKGKIDFKYNISEYWKFLKKYKWLFFSALFILLIFEASYVADKFLFKLIIDKGTEFSTGDLAKDLLVKSFLIIAVVYVGMSVSRSFLKFIQLHVVHRLEAGLMTDIKRKFFNHLVNLGYQFHTTHKTGSLVSKLIRSSSAIERMTDVIIWEMAPLIFQLLVIVLSLIYFSWIPAVIITVTMILFIGYTFFTLKRQEWANIRLNDLDDLEKANVSDIFTNIDSIKYFGKESLIKSKFKKITENTKKAIVRSWDYFRLMDTVQGIILSTGIFLVMYFPIIQFINGEITLGTVVFIYTVFGTLMGPLFSFVNGIRGFYRSMADFEVLFRYNKIENEIKDKPDAKNLKVKQGTIEFKNVSFNYGKKRAFALNDFSLNIKKNEKIALVGHSGCGKTTLIKMLYRFYDSHKGAILLDEKNIKDFKQESVRGELSIVPQECVLFDDTIYNNIKFSNPNATRKQVMDAMKFSQLDKVVKNFPEKENTVVGERGVKLSGGEKQRVSIARAILADKKILVLDEATSALDSETEAEIQKALQKLLQGRTSIIIAHRLSTIMNSDRIIVMKGGKIIEEGSHRELIRRNGEYGKLWNLQKGGYIK